VKRHATWLLLAGTFAGLVSVTGCNATRRELSSALDETDEVRAVHVAVDDGSVVATVEVGSPADEATVRLILDRYAVTWKVVMKP